jgi:hypothetical protein
MTAEPIRDPDAEEPRAPVADVPTPDPTASPTAGGEVSAAEASSATGGVIAESTAVDGAALDSGALGAGAIDAGAAEAPPETPAVTTETPAVAAETPAVAAEAPAVAAETPAAAAKPSRRPVILGAIRKLAILVIAVSLFVVGIGLGQLTFQRTRPAPVVADAPITVANTPPEVAQEFITALGANDADAMRSALAAQPNKDLTDEFERFSIKKIVSVQTLGTSVDGTRSATEILLKAEKTDGLPFEVNLVILVDGGAIEGFR